ncbi:MAG: hypothetical protein ABIJ21_08855 [Nanoarchaeota archaeon]
MDWRDPYIQAIDVLNKGELKELFTGRRTARIIECLPAVFINETITLEPLIDQAIADGVQNQLYYLLFEAQEIAEENRLSYNPQPVLERLAPQLLPDIQSIGRFPPKMPLSELQEKSRVRGRFTHESFLEQYRVYQYGCV